MKTKSTAAEVLLIALLLTPFVYLALIWNQLPAEIVTRYDLQGKPNGSMAKDATVWLMAGTSLLIYLLLRFLPSIDPKKQLQTSNYQRLRVVVTLSFAAIVGWIWYMADRQANATTSVGPILALAGLMIAGIGNYLTTIKPNYFVGIRTPWTLDNETVWRRTHRLGGRLMVAGGLLSAVLVLVVPTPYKIGAFMGIVAIVVFVPVVYSYVYFREEKARQLN